MKKSFVCTAVGSAAIVTAALAAFSGGQPQDKHSAPDLSAMTSKMEELGKVGPKHAILNQFVGSWECQTKIWCPLQTEPLESRGTMNVKKFGDGRFVQAEYSGNVPMPGPDGKPKDMPYKGTMLWGYSNADSEYQSVWADSMNTTMTWMTGNTENESSNAYPNSVMLKGECKGPNDAGQIVKQTTWHKITMESGDKFRSELWSEEPGTAKHKVMEITYSRLGGVSSVP